MFALVLGVAQAGDITWSPTNGVDWNTQQNWSPNGLPGANSNVIFNSGWLEFDANTGASTISSFQNSGSSTANFFVSGANGPATLTVTNGMTGGGNLEVQIPGGTGGETLPTLNLGGTPSLGGSVSLSNESSLNLLANATATMSALDVDGGSGNQAIVTVGSGGSLTTRSVTLADLNNVPTGFINLNSGAVSVTHDFNIRGQAILNSGAALSLTGTSNLGQFYSGGPNQTGGFLDNGGFIGAGSGAGTPNLGSDLQMGGSTDGTIAAGFEANSNLTVNNTAASTITLNSGTIGKNRQHQPGHPDRQYEFRRD